MLFSRIFVKAQIDNQKAPSSNEAYVKAATPEASLRTSSPARLSQPVALGVTPMFCSDQKDWMNQTKEQSHCAKYY
jgi:hypothetical protein